MTSLILCVPCDQEVNRALSWGKDELPGIRMHLEQEQAPDDVTFQAMIEKPQVALPDCACAASHGDLASSLGTFNSLRAHLSYVRSIN